MSLDAIQAGKETSLGKWRNSMLVKTAMIQPYPQGYNEKGTKEVKIKGKRNKRKKEK